MRKVETVRLCDICLASGADVAGRPVSVLLAGSTDRADLCDSHFGLLQAALRPFAETRVQRRVGPGGSGG